MNNEESTSESSFVVGKAIASALVKAQSEYGPALKSSQNPHFRSKYADLASCVDAVVGALNKHGIAFMQRVLPCASGVTVETVFIHTSGETLSSGALHVPVQKNDAQGYGSALTYARRYSLMSACGIAPEDDDGNAASAKQSPEAATKQTKQVAATPAPAQPKKAISEDDDRIPF
jgi:phage tail protein X